MHLLSAGIALKKVDGFQFLFSCPKDSNFLISSTILRQSRQCNFTVTVSNSFATIPSRNSDHHIAVSSDGVQSCWKKAREKSTSSGPAAFLPRMPITWLITCHGCSFDLSFEANRRSSVIDPDTSNDR